MAEGKKSFILYTDLIHTVDKLTDKKAGELFKHILNYVNDKDPQTEDLIIEVAFEPIKQQLKRDLIKWENLRAIRSESGKLGGLESGKSRRKKKQSKANKASASISKQTEANEAVNVNDNVNVNDSVSKKKFAPPTLQEFIEYCNTTGHNLDANNIWHGYNDANWHKADGRKIKNWKQTVRQVWCKPENKKKPLKL